MGAVEAEIINEDTEMRIKSAQKIMEDNGLKTWKLYVVAGLILTSFCAAFYASVVSSGTIALIAIGLLILSIVLGYYFIKSMFD
jgi:hypothetical protein